MNLKKELELLYGKTLYGNDIAEITLSYRIANGIEGRVKESDKVALLETERAKISKQGGLLVSVPAQAITPKPKTRVKTKRDAHYSGFTSIAFSLTDKTKRYNVSLENEYVKALELIAPTNRNQWLSDTVTDYIAANGVESTTRIVKLALVSELVKRASKVKK